MNAFALGGLLTFIASVIVVVAALMKHPRQMLHNLFIFLTITVGIWGFCSFRIGLIQIQDRELALLWYKIAHIGVILVPVAFFHFIFTFVEKKEKWPVWTAYGLGIFFFITLIQGHLIKNVEWVFDSFYYDGRPPTMLYTIFTILWWVSVIYAHTVLFFNLRRATSTKKEQIKYLFLAVALGFSGGITCFLPVFGLNIYPFGNMLVPLYPIISGYAIVRHHLLDINIVIRKGLVYSILVACVTAFYLFIIFISEKFLQGLVGYNSNVVSCLTALAMAFTFTPFKNLIQRFVDQFFFKGNPLELAEQNQQMRRELIQTEKYKNLGTFSSGVAHEIKNPLTAIKTFSEYLPQKMEDKEFLAKFARIVGKEVERVNQLVHSLLDYGKPLPTKSEEVDIHPLIQETLDILSSRLISQKVKLVTHFDGGVQNAVPLRIFVDPQQTRQILLNLFINAIEAMPSGGDLFVDTARIQDEFILTVKDTGCGISKENLKKIFNPFFTTKQTGTGLGLCVTQSILESMNGQLEIDSKVGVGTEIRVRLPLKINVPLTH